MTEPTIEKKGGAGTLVLLSVMMFLQFFLCFFKCLAWWWSMF